MSSFRRLALAAAFSAATAPMVYAEMQSPSAARHILNLDDVEIGALIEDVSVVTGYTFIVHPDAKSKRVTVMSQTRMSSEEVFDVFLSTLRVHGFAAVPAGRDTYRIVPEQSAVGEAGARGGGENSFVTEIMQLDNFNAVEAAQMVKPLVDAQGQVVANARSNTLVVVDYASNMERLRAVVRSLDEDRNVVETLALENVPAAELQKILTDLNGARGDASSQFTVVASETSNSIILRGDEAAVARAMLVAEELDETDPVRDNLRIVKLNNADASGIVPILEKVGATMTAQRAPGDGAVPTPTVDFHEPTNSLVISANYETLLAMERVIEALDRRRAQVLVEAIIVEMSDDTARELGVQFVLSGSGNSTTPFVSSTFNRAAPNLLALAGALAGDDLFGNGDDSTTSSGSNPFTSAAVSSLLNVEGSTIGVGGRDGDTLFGVILNAIERDTESRILSTPFGMALDNAKTSLLVGQNVPLTSGEALGANNQNPFRTVEREDIGVKLDVTPKISDDGSVRLEIFQEVSSIDTAVSSVSQDLILSTRTIDTSVLADDGDIIVLGGLIEQRETLTNSKVPLLGDIPGVGRLFRSEGTSTDRTNLVVFIKPTIIRDADDAARATSQKYRYVRAEEIFNGTGDSSSLDGFIDEVLGGGVPGDTGS